MKKVLAILLAGVMALSVMACGGEEDFDAKGYVQACLDAKYQREYADYAKFCGVTEDEAKEQLESEFEASLEEQMAATGLTSTEEQFAEYVQLEVDVRAKVTYEVKDAVKDDDDNFTVEVVVTPVNAYGALNDTFTADLQEAVNNGAGTDEYMGIFVSSFRKCVESAEVTEAVSVTLHVTWEEQDGQKVYSIDEDEIMDFDMTATGQM